MVPVVATAVEHAEHRRRVAAELESTVAPARSVARSLIALPILAVPGLAALTGIDLVGFYLRDPVGRVVLAAVLVLLVVAVGWMQVVLTRAAPARVAARESAPPRPVRWWHLALVPVVWLLAGIVPGLAIAAWVWTRWRAPDPLPTPHLSLAADLVAVAVSAGHDLATALRLAADQLEDGTGSHERSPRTARARAELAVDLRRLGLELALRPEVVAAGMVPDDPVGRDPLARTVVELARSGAPGVEVLRDLARRLRADRATGARVAAARLPSQLTFPTALVLVPATVLAIGAPIVLQGLAVVTGT